MEVNGKLTKLISIDVPDTNLIDFTINIIKEKYDIPTNYKIKDGILCSCYTVSMGTHSSDIDSPKRNATKKDKEIIELLNKLYDIKYEISNDN